MVVEESPKSKSGAVDLTEVDAESGAKRDLNAKGPKPPSEVIRGLLWQAGRKDCAVMDGIPNGCFTHSVYALNH